MKKRTVTTIKLHFSVLVSPAQLICVLLDLRSAAGCHKVTCCWVIGALGILSQSQGQPDRWWRHLTVMSWLHEYQAIILMIFLPGGSIPSLQLIAWA